MSGIGLQPAGTSPAGLGTPATATADSGVILRDEKTGYSLGSRKIDPSSSDYQIDDSGRLLGMDNVQQIVLLAILNAQDALASIDRLNDGFTRAATGILTDALSQASQQGLVQVLGVQGVKLGERDGLKPGQAVYQLLWRDLTKGVEHSTRI